MADEKKRIDENTEVLRGRVADEIEWFKALCEALDDNEIELVKESIRGAIELKQRELDKAIKGTRL